MGIQQREDGVKRKKFEGLVKLVPSVLKLYQDVIKPDLVIIDCFSYLFVKAADAINLPVIMYTP